MKPWPPKIWVASRAFSTAASEATNLAIAASFLNGLPVTRRIAASYQASRAEWALASMSATLNWSAWYSPILCPETSRFAMYERHSSMQPWASPTDNAATATRPSSSTWRNCAYPRPSSPSRWSRGTRQSENESSFVSDDDQPTFEYFFVTLSPGVPAGTMMAEICLRPLTGSPVTAATVTTPVTLVPEFVMKALVP